MHITFFFMFFIYLWESLKLDFFMVILHYFVRVLYFDTLSVHLLQMKVYKSYNFSIVFYYYSIEWLSLIHI